MRASLYASFRLIVLVLTLAEGQIRLLSYAFVYKGLAGRAVSQRHASRESTWRCVKYDGGGSCSRALVL